MYNYFFKNSDIKCTTEDNDKIEQIDIIAQEIDNLEKDDFLEYPEDILGDIYNSNDVDLDEFVERVVESKACNSTFPIWEWKYSKIYVHETCFKNTSKNSHSTHKCVHLVQIQSTGEIKAFSPLEIAYYIDSSDHICSGDNRIPDHFKNQFDRKMLEANIDVSDYCRMSLPCQHTVDIDGNVSDIKYGTDIYNLYLKSRQEPDQHFMQYQNYFTKLNLRVILNCVATNDSEGFNKSTLYRSVMSETKFGRKVIEEFDKSHQEVLSDKLNDILWKQDSDYIYQARYLIEKQYNKVRMINLVHASVSRNPYNYNLRFYQYLEKKYFDSLDTPASKSNTGYGYHNKSQYLDKTMNQIKYQFEQLSAAIYFGNLKLIRYLVEEKNIKLDYNIAASPSRDKIYPISVITIMDSPLHKLPINKKNILLEYLYDLYQKNPESGITYDALDELLKNRQSNEILDLFNHNLVENPSMICQKVLYYLRRCGVNSDNDEKLYRYLVDTYKIIGY